MSTLTWLHLSDLHLRTSDVEKYNARFVLDKLLEDVRGFIDTQDLAPDLIFCTGDIAFSGQEGEYKLAANFFDRLLQAVGHSGEKERIFIVPGNHDVNWGLITLAAQKKAECLDSRDAVTQVLLSPKSLRLFLQRQDKYAEFVNSYFPKNCLIFDDEHYFHVRSFEVGEGVQKWYVATLGLNSAWVAEGGENDRVVVGECQVQKALEDPITKDAYIRIALLHHPFEQLRDFDHEGVKRHLEQGCDFILVGHRHEQKIRLIQEPDRDTILIPAGAAYEGRDNSEVNAYNIVHLDLVNGQGVLHLREYSHRADRWVEDTRTYGTSRFTFSLPKRLVQLCTTRQDSSKYDRDTEMELFRDVLRRERSARGIVVHSHGEGGWGKSSLMEMFRQECGLHEPCIRPFTFRAHEESVRWEKILRDTAARLGIDHFPKFWSLLDSMLYSRKESQATWMGVRYSAVNALDWSSQTWETREAEAMDEQKPARISPREAQKQLTDLFLEELEALVEPDQVVWLIDTVEAVEPETEVWLADMLGRIARQETSKVVLVIAGRTPIPYNAAWKHAICELDLKGLPRDAIRKLAQNRGMTGTDKTMERFVDLLVTTTLGNPLKICSFLDSGRLPVFTERA